MREAQLYIGNDRLDMFKDESVEVTQSIKNVRDISKVFTTFSKQFSVPASKNNNAIFKHYYAANNFDARTRKDGRIEVNGATFRRGKVRLDGVDMRNNSPYAYRVTFFGSVIELKDILKEDKLPSLTDLDIDFDYSSSKILSNLLTLHSVDSTSTTQTGISLPFITHSQRIYYDSGNDSLQSGNLHYGSTVQGVKHRQLKYAVRLDKIIDAIEGQYDITFATDSFFHDDTKDIHKIYLWCHRKTGQVTIEAGNEQKVPFTPTSFQDYFNIDVDGDAVPVSNAGANDTLVFLGDMLSTSRGEYDLIIKKNGNIERIYEKVSGTISPTFSTGAFSAGDQYAAYIRTYDESVTFNSLTWEFKQNGASVSPRRYEESSDNTYESSFKFNIAENLPEMKIIDFLSSLFRMFNLVAYVQDDDTIQVEPLDDYYGNSRDQEITKYVDIEKSQVNTAIPFKEVFFKYADTETILAKQHFQELSEVEWGGIEYSHTAQLDGEIYKIQPDFAHAKYERLIDVSDASTDTGVQVGYYVNENEESYGGKPLLLYINNHSPSVDISFVANDARIQIASSQSINMPSNTETINSASSNSLHFSDEISEYTRTSIDDDKNLFSRFYENYITNVFDSSNRITKVTAVLPIGKIIDIQMYDVIIISGKKYRINSMTTNLSDGRTNFELINYYTI